MLERIADVVLRLLSKTASVNMSACHRVECLHQLPRNSRVEFALTLVDISPEGQTICVLEIIAKLKPIESQQKDAYFEQCAKLFDFERSGQAGGR